VLPGFILITEAISEVSNVTPKLKKRSLQCLWSTATQQWQKSKDWVSCLQVLLKQMAPVCLLT